MRMDILPPSRKLSVVKYTSPLASLLYLGLTSFWWNCEKQNNYGLGMRLVSGERRVGWGLVRTSRIDVGRQRMFMHSRLITVKLGQELLSPLSQLFTYNIWDKNNCGYTHRRCLDIDNPVINRRYEINVLFTSESWIQLKGTHISIHIPTNVKQGSVQHKIPSTSAQYQQN